MRVSALANELGVDPKDIRKFLRSRYGQVGLGGRWDLDNPQVEQVRWTFGREIRRGTRGGILVPPLVRRQAGPDIADKARRLQAEPQDIHIKVVGSSEDLVFHKIIDCWADRRSRRRSYSTVVLLSNGEFKESKDLTEISNWLLESQYRLIRRGERYYAHHWNYVQALSEISIPQWLIPKLIERSQATSRDDTPQELLIGDYARTFDSKLHTIVILKWEYETGKSILELTLKELGDSKFNGYRSSPYGSDFYLVLSRYFATINLLQENPQDSKAFDITVGELFQRFHIEVGQKAEGLRRDIALRFGFEEYDNNGWRKRKLGDEVVISSDLRVHINHKFVCIVSSKSSLLPYEDEVARRMLAVATAHRNQIYTIKGEAKEALERLFPSSSGNPFDKSEPI